MRDSNSAIPIDACVIRRNGRFRVIFSPMDIDVWVNTAGLVEIKERVMATPGVDGGSKRWLFQQIEQALSEYDGEFLADMVENACKLAEPESSIRVLALLFGLAVSAFLAGLAVGMIWL